MASIIPVTRFCFAPYAERLTPAQSLRVVDHKVVCGWVYESSGDDEDDFTLWHPLKLLQDYLSRIGVCWEMGTLFNSASFVPGTSVAVCHMLYNPELYNSVDLAFMGTFAQLGKPEAIMSINMRVRPQVPEPVLERRMALIKANIEQLQEDLDCPADILGAFEHYYFAIERLPGVLTVNMNNAIRTFVANLARDGLGLWVYSHVPGPAYLVFLCDAWTIEPLKQFFRTSRPVMFPRRLTPLTAIAE